MARVLLAGLRLCAAAGVGVALMSTLWILNEGQLSGFGIGASLCASVIVYVFAKRPAPRPWSEPQAEPVQAPSDAAQ